MEKGGGRVVIWEFAMSIGPHDKQTRLLRGADSVLPSQHSDDDEFFDVLGPALEEVAGLQSDESPHQETEDLLLLLEENARLRKLAVQLSKLLGDLPPFSFPATPTGGQMRPSPDGRSTDEHATAEPTQPLVLVGNAYHSE
jgi:hypothetical protein